MHKTTITGVTISAVERTHAWWRYLWPFQSRRALLQILAVMAVCLPIMAAVIVYKGNPNALLYTLIGAAAGGLLGGVYPLLPARLTLTTRSEARHHLADLQGRLVKIGYVLSEQSMVPGRFHYCSGKTLKRLRWDEQNIELLVHEHELVLNGPVVVLRRLRYKMMPDDYAFLKA